MSRETLLRANDELATFYTSSLGPKVQSFESNGPRSGPGDFDVGIVRELDDAIMRSRPTRIQTFDAVRATLAEVMSQTRRVLDAVYTPCGTGFVPSRKQTEERARAKANGEEIAPDFLAIALTPKWGSGSFVRLALTQARTLRAFERQYPGRHPDPASVLAFLSFEAGLGDASHAFFRQLREDCEGPRTGALEAYDVLRLARLDQEAKEKRARRERSEAIANAILDRERGKLTRRNEARLARLGIDLSVIDRACMQGKAS